MKIVDTIGCQGDVLLRRTDSIPESFKEEKKGRLIVAHSETGHHHAIEEVPGASLFVDPADPFTCYLRMEGIDHADLVHHRDFHTHETIRLLGDKTGITFYEVKRQRERTPQGWARVQD